MAEELAKEILSQSRTMAGVKSALAFKFEQQAGKVFIIQTLTRVNEPNNNSSTGASHAYLVTIKDQKGKHTITVHDKETLYKLVLAYTGIHAFVSARYKRDHSFTSFELISLNGEDEKVLTEFTLGSPSYATFKSFLEMLFNTENA